MCRHSCQGNPSRTRLGCCAWEHHLFAKLVWHWMDKSAILSAEATQVGKLWSTVHGITTLLPASIGTRWITLCTQTFRNESGTGQSCFCTVGLGILVIINAVFPLPVPGLDQFSSDALFCETAFSRPLHSPYLCIAWTLPSLLKFMRIKYSPSIQVYIISGGIYCKWQISSQRLYQQKNSATAAND